MKTPEELNEDQINDYPFWAWDLADESSSPMVPLKTSKEIEKNSRSIAIRAKFLTNSGRTFVGYITWYKDKEIRSIQPTIVIKDEQFFFYFGVVDIPGDYASRIQKTIGSNAFPIKYESEVSQSYPQIKGTLYGL